MYKKSVLSNINIQLHKLLASYRTRLIIALLVCSLIPLLIIGYISYYTSYQLAENRIMDSVSVSTKQLVQQLNNRFSQMESVADSTNQYAYILNHKSKNVTSEYMDTFNSSRSNINMLTNNFHLFQTCVFMPDDALISKEGLMFYGISDLKRFQITSNMLTGIGVNSKWIYRSRVIFPQILSPNDRAVDTIYCCQSLTQSGEVIYALFSSLKASELTDLLTESFDGTPIRSYICTPDRDIAASTNPLAGKLYENQYYKMLSHANGDFFRLDNSEYIVQRLDNGFLLITEIPTSYISQNIFNIIRAVLLSFVILIPFLICIIIFTSHGLTKKLLRLEKVVRSTNISHNRISAEEFGHLFNMHSPYMDEVDNLAASYQSMLNTIDKNITNIITLTVNEEQLKYKLLQSQINPHFLYNILGSIQTCLTIGKFDIAFQMAQDLSKFYRITLRKNNDLISIHDEIEIATLYLELEKLLKQDTFSYEIHCADGLEHFMICKFTLQPFLENSIHHGLQRSNKPIHISLDLQYGEDTVMIQIKDDGVGMDAATLSRIQNSLDAHLVDYTQDFGICNVNARIASPLYGSGSIHIDSDSHAGTCVTIEFQQLIDENNITYCP